MRLIYSVIHTPDGGEPRKIATFLRKGDAIGWAKDLTLQPGNDIRLVEVMENRTKVASFGWVIEMERKV